MAKHEARRAATAKAAATAKKPAKGSSTPSARLAAIAGRKARQASGSLVAPRLAPRDLATVRTKFVVSGRTEVPKPDHGIVETRFQIVLKPAYEARSVMHGLETRQGNADNMVFGTGLPDGEIVMTLASKAVADAFRAGKAFHVEFHELLDEGYVG